MPQSTGRQNGTCLAVCCGFERLLAISTLLTDFPLHARCATYASRQAVNDSPNVRLMFQTPSSHHPILGTTRGTCQDADCKELPLFLNPVGTPLTGTCATCADFNSKRGALHCMRQKRHSHGLIVNLDLVLWLGCDVTTHWDT